MNTTGGFLNSITVIRKEILRGERSEVGARHMALSTLLHCKLGDSRACSQCGSHTRWCLVFSPMWVCGERGRRSGCLKSSSVKCTPCVFMWSGRWLRPEPWGCSCEQQGFGVDREPCRRLGELDYRARCPSVLNEQDQEAALTGSLQQRRAGCSGALDMDKLILQLPWTPRSPLRVWRNTQQRRVLMIAMLFQWTCSPSALVSVRQFGNKRLVFFWIFCLTFS